MNLPEISTKYTNSLSLTNFLSSENIEEQVLSIYKNLSGVHKCISSRYFYDEIGSMLFEDISTLPEYYLTETEMSVLKGNAKKILGEMKHTDIIELGSGDCSKISVLLDAIPKNKLQDINYIPVDISETAILKSAEMLSLKYPELKINGMLADFLKHLDHLPGENDRLICFFGSTIGNLSRQQSLEFLLNIKSLMRKTDKFLLGLDMVKEIQILHNAYNDSQGITALFNKNILNVINDIAGTNFDLADFEHKAWYNRTQNRIEMHLEALKDITICSLFFPKEISLKRGETIHTENSHKYIFTDIEYFASVSDLKISRIYTDSQKWFSLVEFVAG